MPPLPTFNMPNWKLLEQPVLPAQGTSVDLAPFVIMFLLLAAAACFLLKLKRRQMVRHVVQFLAACAFVLGVSPCGCMVRDFILGSLAINLDNLEAYRRLVTITTIVAFSLVFGRAFCSWVCPLGSLQELAACVSRRTAGTRRTSAMRYVAAVVALAAVVVSFLASKPRTLVFSEMAMVFWAMALFIIILFAVNSPAHERWLKRLRYISLVLVALVYLVRVYTGGPFCVMFRDSLDYSSIISAAGVVVASLILALAWCKFLCPEGALFGLLSRRAAWRVAKTQHCTNCNTCGESCLMQAVEQGHFDRTSCVLCGRCVERCPEGALRYEAAHPRGAPSPVAPGPEP